MGRGSLKEEKCASTIRSANSRAEGEAGGESILYGHHGPRGSTPTLFPVSGSGPGWDGPYAPDWINGERGIKGMVLWDHPQGSGCRNQLVNLLVEPAEEKVLIIASPALLADWRRLLSKDKDNIQFMTPQKALTLQGAMPKVELLILERIHGPKTTQMASELAEKADRVVIIPGRDFAEQISKFPAPKFALAPLAENWNA